MVFELVKNSLRAVQERYMDSDRVSPPVRIIVADGIEDVTIKVLCSSLKLSMKVSTSFLFHLLHIWPSLQLLDMLPLRNCVVQYHFMMMCVTNWSYWHLRSQMKVAA